VNHVSLLQDLFRPLFYCCKACILKAICPVSTSALGLSAYDHTILIRITIYHLRAPNNDFAPQFGESSLSIISGHHHTQYCWLNIHTASLGIPFCSALSAHASPLPANSFAIEATPPPPPPTPDLDGRQNTNPRSKNRETASTGAAARLNLFQAPNPTNSQPTPGRCRRRRECQPKSEQ